ncbi:MAG: FAD-binding protein [Anaerostipes faecalis]|nr:FAD-binding protein [Anaerostipes faecalis]
MPPIIDKEKCKKCGLCAEIYPLDVLKVDEISKEILVRYLEECWHCRACVLDCSSNAIRMRYPLTHFMLYRELKNQKKGNKKMKLKRREKIEKTDILIVGGGIGGLQAAISAGEAGAKVIVAEKTHVNRSGNGSTGNDHFLCYIPKIHGDDIRHAMEDIKDTMDGPAQDEEMLYTLLKHSEELVEKWQSYGINMKPMGKYHFEGHTIPGRPHYHLKFDGRKQKECLVREAVKQGAIMHNHITISNLLVNKEGKVIGAVGADVSDDIPELVVYQAKAVIIATGPNSRMFPGTVPAALFNMNGCPVCTGGAILAYRAGARLVNYDIIGCHAGPRYFIRSGKATWIGMLSDSEGNSVGPFVNKPSREYGDPMSDIWPGVFADKLKDGTGPVYMNCTGLSEEDIRYMQHCFETEGISSVNDYLEQKQIDLRKCMIEFGSYGKAFAAGGIDVDTEAAATVEGLYAAGTVCGNLNGHITSAAVFGEISGKKAADYIKTVEEETVENHPLITETEELY